MKKYEFDAVILKRDGQDTAYIEFPYDVETEFGVKGQVKVRATFNGIDYRGSLAKMGTHCHILGLTQQIRRAIGKQAGDTVHIVLHEDMEPRTVDIPDDFGKLLDENREARDFFNALSYTNSRVRTVTMKNDSINLMSKAVPTAILLLTAILLGNVIGRLIKHESVIAGALYALGYKRKEIYRHYLKFPLVIAVIGGVLGLFIVRPELLLLLGYFAIPLTGIDYSPSVMIISLLLPVLFLGLSGWFVIRKELKHSPVELMKGDKEKSKVNFLERMFKLEKLNFAAKFKIREQFRSLPRLALLLAGCAAATVLLLYGFFLKSSMDYLLTSSLKNAYDFQYEYVFKSPRTDPAPAGSEPFSGSKFLPLGDDNRDFYVVGVLPDSAMYTLVGESGARLSMNQVIITKPLANQMKVKQGDTVNIVRKADYQEFSLKVGSIADSHNRFIFMPLAEYNEKFGMPEGSYTGLGSNDIGVGFAVVMLSYELSKLLCRKKVNAVSMSEALKAGME